ncbi:hypothetical protein [uncultured Marinococcus sp.]|uniref:hypothetical protein n=1 Tax=uncultured Marinococcus sp. TaxID=487012 RepID=UPI00262400E0|nr:hypothetical protein [uncultured Marinococcus sp.]
MPNRSLQRLADVLHHFEDMKVGGELIIRLTDGTVKVKEKNDDSGDVDVLVDEYDYAVNTSVNEFLTC